MALIDRVHLRVCRQEFERIEATLSKFKYRKFEEIDFGTFPIDSIRQTMEGSYFSAERQLRDLLENEVGNFFKEPDAKRHELTLLNNLLAVYTNFYEATFQLLTIKQNEVVELIKNIRNLITLFNRFSVSPITSVRSSSVRSGEIWEVASKEVTRLERLQLLVGMEYSDAEELVSDRYPLYSLRVTSIGGVSQEVTQDVREKRINVDIDPVSNKIVSVLGFG
jgi:hypothetical protein